MFGSRINLLERVIKRRVKEDNRLYTVAGLADIVASTPERVLAILKKDPSFYISGPGNAEIDIVYYLPEGINTNIQKGAVHNGTF